MSTGPESLRKTLARAIRESGLTCREVARDAGLDLPRMARLFQKGGRSLDAAEALARVLGLSLTRVEPPQVANIFRVDDMAAAVAELILAAEAPAESPLPHSQVRAKDREGLRCGRSARIASGS